MKQLEFRQNWMAPGIGEPEISGTMSLLEIYAGETKLTKNQNIWSQSIHDHILVSTYPLAMWFLQSWWRLIFEPLPSYGCIPTIDWRMAHEMGAANQGFVWPKVVFTSDSEEIHVWATPSGDECQQSVRYINGLRTPVSVPIKKFQQSITDFVLEVVNRLDAINVSCSELSELWGIISEEQQNPEISTYRKLEALMGFDPDECDEEIMRYAIELNSKYGEETLSELAPVYGKSTDTEPLKFIEHFIDAAGVKGKPSLVLPNTTKTKRMKLAPWQNAVNDAQFVRKQIGNEKEPINTDSLFDLLGIASKDIDKWRPEGRSKASVGIPTGDQSIKFVPRKKHPISKRFELARYLGDYIHTHRDRWLTNTDLGTARQKYQRAFAAEFLCPFNGLKEFLQDDFSEDAIDDAAENFDVSQQTTTSLLANNGLIDRPYPAGVPYTIGSTELRHLG
jgi:hypothetical protein